VRKLIIVVVLLGLLTFAFLLPKVNQKATEVSQNKKIDKLNMKIISSAFGNNAKIPPKYTCDGENINPPLSFVDVPKEIKSLALIMDDPDAPMGTFVHWVLFNINPTTKGIDDNSVPNSAVQGLNSMNKPGYIGPCPPSGSHRYFFKLYALDSMLNLNVNADKKGVEKTMQGHILKEAQLIGLYNKKN